MEIYERKELPLSKTFSADNLHFAIYKKFAIDNENLVELSNGDFIFSYGTFVYQEQFGPEGLKAFYNDFDESLKAVQDVTQLMGQYGLVLRKNGQLYVLNDNAGIIRIHHAQEDGDICISNSFLATLAMLDKKHLSKHEVYEFLFNKAVYGNKTICKEVALIDSHKVIKLVDNQVQMLPKKIDMNQFAKDQSLTFEESLNQMVENTKKYFAVIKNQFDGKISCDLTGGSDTRLMHCLLKNAEAKYNAVTYSVNVDPRCKEYPEVKIAKHISEKEGLKHTVGKTQEEIPNYAQELLKTYYVNDGLLHRLLYEGPQWRKLYEERSKFSSVVLHGQGGECFRDRGVLFDNSVSMMKYIHDYPYNFVPYDYSYCKNFQIKDYSNTVCKKMDELLEDFVGKPVRELGVWEKEMMYNETYHKFFGSRKVAWLHQYLYMFDPFIDPQIAYPSFKVPFVHKQDTKLMNAMKETLSPEMLSYPQFHGGYSIQDQKSPLKKFIYKTIRKMPYSVIRFFRNMNEGRQKAKQVAEYGTKMPVHLTDECLSQIIDTKNIQMKKLVDFDRLDLETTSHLDVLARIYAMEFLIQRNQIQL